MDLHKKFIVNGFAKGETFSEKTEPNKTGAGYGGNRSLEQHSTNEDSINRKQ